MNAASTTISTTALPPSPRRPEISLAAVAIFGASCLGIGYLIGLVPA